MMDYGATRCQVTQPLVVRSRGAAAGAIGATEEHAVLAAPSRVMVSTACRPGSSTG